MDVASCRWDESLLCACGGPELREKIGPEPVLGGTAVGKVTNWWVDRWVSTQVNGIPNLLLGKLKTGFQTVFSLLSLEIVP